MTAKVVCVAAEHHHGAHVQTKACRDPVPEAAMTGAAHLGIGGRSMMLTPDRRALAMLVTLVWSFRQQSRKADADIVAWLRDRVRTSGVPYYARDLGIEDWSVDEVKALIEATKPEQ